MEKDLVTHLKHANQNGQNILHCTAVCSPDCLEYILDRLERNTHLKVLSELCNNNETPLMAAKGCDNNKSAVQILESIAMPPMPRRSIQLTNDYLQFLLIPSKKHTSAFHMAASCGNEMILKSLLSCFQPKGRLIAAEHLSSCGRNLFHCAAEGGNPKIGGTLCSLLPLEYHKRLISKSDSKGNNLLHLAGSCGAIRFMKIVLESIPLKLQLHLLAQPNAYGRLPIAILKDSPELAGEANLTAFEEKQAFKLQNLKYCQHNPILGKIIKSAPHRQIFETTRHIISIGKGVTLF